MVAFCKRWTTMKDVVFFCSDFFLLVSYGVERTARPGHSEILLLSIRALMCREMFIFACRFFIPTFYSRAWNTTSPHPLPQGFSNSAWQSHQHLPLFNWTNIIMTSSTHKPLRVFTQFTQTSNAHFDRIFYCWKQSGNFMKSLNEGKFSDGSSACVY